MPFLSSRSRKSIQRRWVGKNVSIGSCNTLKSKSKNAYRGVDEFSPLYSRKFYPHTSSTRKNRQSYAHFLKRTQRRSWKTWMRRYYCSRKNFAEKIIQDLLHAPRIPNRITICIHLGPHESFDELMMLEGLILRLILESGLLKNQWTLPKLNFRVTKNDVNREVVDTRVGEIEEKFMSWHELKNNKRVIFGSAFHLFFQQIQASIPVSFRPSPLFVGVNTLLVGSRILSNGQLYWLNRWDALILSVNWEDTCIVEWDYRFLHHENTFGISETPEQTLREKRLYDFNLMPWEVHYGHSAANMLRPELRFWEDEFRGLLGKKWDIIALTKQAIRNRIKKW